MSTVDNDSHYGRQRIEKPRQQHDDSNHAGRQAGHVGIEKDHEGANSGEDHIVCQISQPVRESFAEADFFRLWRSYMIYCRVHLCSLARSFAPAYSFASQSPQKGSTGLIPLNGDLPSNFRTIASMTSLVPE